MHSPDNLCDKTALFMIAEFEEACCYHEENGGAPEIDGADLIFRQTNYNETTTTPHVVHIKMSTVQKRVYV